MSKISTLGTRLKAARNHKGLSQGELADLVGISQAAVGKVELDKTENPRGILKYASALGVSPDYLLFGEGSKDYNLADDISLTMAVGILNKHVEKLTSLDAESTKIALTYQKAPDNIKSAIKSLLFTEE
jgi:transcriptional regulator with XRE-family HTH domain